MAPPAEEGADGHGRRKSLGNLLSRASVSNLYIHTDIKNGSGHATTEIVEKKEKKKKKLTKRNSIFGVGPSTSPDSLQAQGNVSATANSPTSEKSVSPMMRPKVLQKARPSSIFGSLGRRSINTEEDTTASLTFTAESPLEDGAEHGIRSMTVLHHGEVQTTSGMFRKKKEYLVLTDTHLFRLKNASRASDIFPQVPPVFGRSATTRHPSTASISSIPQDVQSSTSQTSTEGENRIPLGQIVTAFRVDDGKPFFTTEVVYLDEEANGAGCLQLILHDPKEADLWHTSIRGAAQKVRMLRKEPYPRRVVDYLVEVVAQASDFDADHFKIFRVVRRPAKGVGGRNSGDDFQKDGHYVWYLVVGLFFVHLVPTPDFSEPLQLRIPPTVKLQQFGIVSLVSISVSYSDDRFELAFRLPMRPVKFLDLAASGAPDIAIAIYQALSYLKPLYLDNTFAYKGPKRLLEAVDIPAAGPEPDDYGFFDRTLIAYCKAYDVVPSNITYAVDWALEDAPEFRLYNPGTTAKYTLMELLAIFRALRYNDCFKSINLSGVDLQSMHGLHDQYGVDHVAFSTRQGLSLQKHFNLKPQGESVLYQEIQALGLKSSQLRRLDFTNCLPKRRPTDIFDEEGRTLEIDPGCQIVSGLFPLLKSQLTNVDWVVLSGIELGETDIEAMAPALHEVNSRIRAVEYARCGLNDRGIMRVLAGIYHQSETLECLDISDNPGRVNLETFRLSVGRFSHIRKLDLSRINRTTGDQALFEERAMLSWRLEELILNGIPLNENTLDAISTYLSSESSETLTTLYMDQCNLTGSHVALLMRSMTRESGHARDLELHLSANRLEKGISDFVAAVKDNCTPSTLVVRMIEFTKEDHFRQLLQALRTNSTIKNFDVSKASLGPYDASPETCNALHAVFTDNTTLEFLDISGEHAHLEITRFGIGLNQALTGLKKNKTLKMLKIEYQNLGLEGANALASVIEANTTLTHIYCEHNDINLQGFTILINAVAKNTTILDLPFMQDDQDMSMKRMSESMRDSRRAALAFRSDLHVKSSVRRTLKSLGAAKSPAKPQKLELTPQDVDEVVRVLKQRWNAEIQRLASFLERNRNLAAGIESQPETEDTLRPTTAISDKGIVAQVLSNTTPRVEYDNPINDYPNKFSNLGIGDIDPPPGRYRGVENNRIAEERGEEEDGLLAGNGKINGGWKGKGKVTSYWSEVDGGMLPKIQTEGNDRMFGDEELFSMEPLK